MENSSRSEERFIYNFLNKILFSHYNDIFKINEYFYVTEDGAFRVDTEHKSILQYCNYENTSKKYTCDDYFQLTICSVIHLLKNYKKYGLGHDKLAEYVILWLSYKLNIKENNTVRNPNDFYNNYIEKNKDYIKNIKDDDTTTYKAIIDKIKDLMDIKEISKFNDPFGMLLSLYYIVHGKSLNCEKWSQKANEFVKNFEILNNDSNNIKDSPFSQILSTLSNDYKNLQKKCTNFKSLPELTPQTSPVDNSVKDYGETLGETPEATSSSSSTLNTVIPVLSTFAIPVFLGVAYKYSLFGFDKLFQRQYIRNKLKKVKKKMELNI
ncbi:CIR protein [Plasmodium chabaudi adami]|uniref:CIR protein n=1 Tax=Plasmodium chabaudi adami TaxID=5826 RepID=A0A1C6WRY6_PLACE|nr:CIR protein [Plasmodium chabaudi adami]